MGELQVSIDSAELFKLILVCRSCGTSIRIDMAQEKINVHNITECNLCKERFPSNTVNALRFYRDFCDALKGAKSDKTGAEFKFSVAID